MLGLLCGSFERSMVFKIRLMPGYGSANCINSKSRLLFIRCKNTCEWHDKEYIGTSRKLFSIFHIFLNHFKTETPINIVAILKHAEFEEEFFFKLNGYLIVCI